MEGRSWHVVARDKFGAKIVPDMALNKWYLHQMYTTCFAEFESKRQLERFKDYADRKLIYWDYAPVAVINTSNPEMVEMWKQHMRGQEK